MQRIAVTAALLLLGAVLIVGGALIVIEDAESPTSLVVALFLALGFFYLLLRIDVEQTLGFFEVVGAVLPIVAFTVFSATTPQEGSETFNEVGAQVIIVLLLALAIDTRFFRLRSDRDRLDLAATVFTMILLGCGEFYALQGLFTGDPQHSEMVAGAIAAGFVAVAISALQGPNERSQKQRE